LATTEMSTTIVNGYSGFIDTDVDKLIEKMKLLLKDPDKAKELGKGAKETALEKFNIQRFSADWLQTFQTVIKEKAQRKQTFFA